MKTIVALILVTLISSCAFFKKKKTTDKDVIAMVNNEFLYASDITTLTKGFTGKDSVEILKDYAQDWVRKKLLLQKAQENIADDDAGISKKIEDYHESLLLYEYEKALINRKLDTALTEDEVKQWYEKLKASFPLESDVYAIYFIKLKKDAPDLSKAQKWILSPKNDEDLRKLDGYCKEYAVGYSIDKELWYAKDKAIKNFPVSEYDLSVLSSNKQYREYKVGDLFWYVKIMGVMKKDEPSPLEMIRENIEKAILENRKNQLIEKTYNKIYQDGLASKSFEIYLK